jgi:outer membrane protein
MLKKSNLIFILVFSFLGYGFGKDFDIRTVLQLAEENNKDIKLARNDLEFARAQKKEAISLALPSINANVNYNRNFLENKLFFTVTDSSGRETTQSFTASFTNTYQFSTSLNQTLFGFGKIGNAIQAAGYFNKYSNFAYQAQYNVIITSIKKAFYLALLLNKVWEVAVQSEKSAEENYQNIKIKYDGGAVSEYDLLQAETRWKNSIPLTMQAQKDYELALNNLKALVDIPLREEVNLVGNLDSFPRLPDSLESQIVFKQRPDFNALQWEKKLQEKRVAIENSYYYPTLNGSLSYLYNASSNEFRLDNKNDNVILGISLSIPIFNGFYTSAQVQKARIDVDRVKTRISKAYDDIRIEIKNIRLRMIEARERIEAGQSNIETARRGFEIAETRIENGLATQLELRESRVDLDRAQVNFYSAIYDYLAAYFDWQNAIGEVNTAGI